MGVYHISGLGKSPGAITVPLTLVYLLQVAQTLGNETALKFFAHSGEIKRKSEGSREEYSGRPEAIIAFTSKELIDGKEKIKCTSKWFKITCNKEEKIHSPIQKYLENLFEYLEKNFSYRAGPLNLYLIEVNHLDFDDNFEKIGKTMKGLRDKEVWINMIGGSNQINISLLTAGTYTAVPSRYYYLFQNNIELLEPEIIDKPENVQELNNSVERIVENWRELPVFNLGLGELLRDIYNLFLYREAVNKEEIIKILYKHSLSSQFLAKLGRFLIYENDKIKKTFELDKFVNMWSKLDESPVSNFTEWRKLFEEKNILHHFTIT